MTTDSGKSENPSLRLARYLKEFVGLRTTSIRDVAKYEAVLWFGDMPREPDCRSGAWTDDYDPEEPWLEEVRKQRFRSPPEPPTAIASWVDQSALRVATPEIPPLRTSIFVEDTEIELDDDEAPPLVERHLSDYPEIAEAYYDFRPTWEAWSAEHRRREAVQGVYAELFRLHNQLQKRGEIVEVVLGLGLVDWRSKVGDRSIDVRRHAIVSQVELNFDAEHGVIRLGPPGDGARLRIEDDMLEPELRPDRSHYAVIEAQLEEIGDSIWDRSMMHSALRTWSGALSADSTWSEGLGAKPSNGPNPVVSFAPALILRARLQTGMIRIYEKLIQQLGAGEDEVPGCWRGLTDDEWDGGADAGTAAVNADEKRSDVPVSANETYFPLPANREQRRIVDALQHNQGVLVQGPPGTGKSHTIANLMCHLLATGQRVLITAETARALHVLKAKLPDEIQPLCVSLLGQGGDAFAELNKAVQGITNRYSSYSRGAYDARIAEVDQELDAARRHVAAIDSEIRSLREDETRTHSLLDGKYHGTASQIAARVADEREAFGWMELPPTSDAYLSVSNAEAARWLDIRCRYSSEEVEAATQQIPDSASIPAPADFLHLVSNEAAASADRKRVDALCNHEAFSAIRALSTEQRNDLRQQLTSIVELEHALQRQHVEWLPRALEELVASRDEKWQALRALSREHLEQAERLLPRVGNRTTTRPEGLNPRKLRSDARAALMHMQAGGKWKRFGVVTPKVLKGRTYLKRDVLIDGQPANDIARLRAVCDDLDLEFALLALESAWKDVGIAAVPADRRLRVASLEANLSTLKRALEYAAACERVARLMSHQSPPIATPNWLGRDAQLWAEVINAAELDQRMGEVGQQVEACGKGLSILRRLHQVHPVVQELAGAIDERDVTAYSSGYERLLRIETTRADQTIRLEIEARIEDGAPGLVARVEASLDDPMWGARFASWEKAWQWAVVNGWLERRSDFNYQQRAWRNRRDAESSISRLVAEAASLRAWAHFFERLSTREANALRSWREAVRAMGKGTGKSARLARLRQDARRYMDVCRDAIPIWIMPRYLVAEMIEPAPGRYDLVIVDEASQLGIESLFLFYVAKRVIVVGDDQQISPAGVGISDAAVAGLQEHFLEGVPHRHALSPQSSLYGNAKIRFNQNIVLREHFRCMPEIIQFSNDLCYASNGTPLDPLRAYPANRLEPLALRHISDGYRTGSTQYAQNPPEADAIVAQICACIDDPRYANATMGVISLQGEAQARLIENKLLSALDPEVIEARRLICGDAYAFQGDERNVMFLSMVAAPGEHRIGALTNEAARQRFNVAVSRAQDQLWLFHTAEVEALSPSCMRHRLLSYMLDPKRQTSDEHEQQFDSDFERHVYRRITTRGFHVRTQVCVGDPTNHRYRIDLVVEGMQGRLAVECDGDRWHGPDRYEQDMARQRDLERAGWQFARIRGGDFYRDREQAMEPVWAELERLGIRPGGIDAALARPPEPKVIDPRILRQTGTQGDAPGMPPAPEQLTRRPESAQRRGQTDPGPSPGPSSVVPVAAPVSYPSGPATPASPPASEPERSLFPVNARMPGNHEAAPYLAFQGRAGPDPRIGTCREVAEGLCRIIEQEGPMVAKRAYDLYLRGGGVRRMGGELKRSMNKALQYAIRTGRVTKEDESGDGGLVHSVVRAIGTRAVVLRERGPRDFEEIPPSELQLVARRLVRTDGFESGSDAHLRAVLEFFDLKRLTVQVGTRLLDLLTRPYRYVDEILASEEGEP